MADPPDPDSPTFAIACHFVGEYIRIAKIDGLTEGARLAETVLSNVVNAREDAFHVNAFEDLLTQFEDDKADEMKQLEDTRATLCDNLGITAGDLDDAVFKDHSQMLLRACSDLADRRVTGGLSQQLPGQPKEGWEAIAKATLDRKIYLIRPPPQTEQQIATHDSDYEGDNDSIGSSNDDHGTSSTAGTASETFNEHDRAGSSENSVRVPTASPTSAAAMLPTAMLPTTEQRRARWTAELERIRDDASAHGAVPVARWAPEPPDSGPQQGKKRKFEDDEGQSG